MARPGSRIRISSPMAAATEADRAALPAPILEPTAHNLGLAAAALREGRLVAFPTETVYGLGGDATSDRAVAAIYAAKGRPSFNPLIVHVGNAAAAGRFVELTPAAE